jgi:hypothetical protein
MPFWKFFSEGRKLEQCFRTFFPGFVITNTTPLQPNFGSLFSFWNILKKITLLASKFDTWQFMADRLE